MNSIRIIPRLARAFPQTGKLVLRRPLLLGSTTAIKPFSSCSAFKSSRVAPVAPGKTHNAKEALGTQKGLPEFNLIDRVVLVSGGARGLGLTQAGALLEAGAKGWADDTFLNSGTRTLNVSVFSQFTRLTSLKSQAPSFTNFNPELGKTTERPFTIARSMFVMSRNSIR